MAIPTRQPDPRASAPAALNPRLAQEGTARLFRSVRAGRSWLRAQESAGAPAADSCVTMKPGHGAPAIFMIPGAPGSILQLGPLAVALSVPMPVYAIKPRGLEEAETPCRTIAEMAEYGIGVMRAAAPHGPYVLIGYSAGGLVALEAAQRLRAVGQPVPLVVLIDCYPSRATWPLHCHVDVLARQAVRATAALLRHLPFGAASDAMRRLRSLSFYLAASGVKGLPPLPVVAEGSSEASRRVYTATYDAGEAYRPARYAGRVVFVQPGEVPNLEPRTPALVWRQFLDDFAILRVPGTHLGMVQEDAAATAAAIDACLAEAGVVASAVRDPAA